MTVRATAADDFAALTKSLTSVGTHYTPSPLVAFHRDWVGVVSGDGDASALSTIVAARHYGNGRVLAFGENGFCLAFNERDNRQMSDNWADWLSGTAPRVIGTLAGHGEVYCDVQLQDWRSRGFTIQTVSAPVTASALNGIGILVVNPPFYLRSPYSASDLDVIAAFVSNGGGLFVYGLGWSFQGQPWEFGANQIGRRFGIYFPPLGVTDPMHNFGAPGSPIFQTFYPSASQTNVPLAYDTIRAAHASHLTNLDAAVESDGALRAGYIKALQTIATANGLPPDDPDRLALDAFCAEMTGSAYGLFLLRNSTYDVTRFSTMAWLRERFYRIWIETIALSQTQTQRISTLGQLGTAYAQILSNHGVYVADNGRLSASQLAFIDALLTEVPASLHNLRFAAFVEFLANPSVPWPGMPPEMSWADFFSGGGASINSFGSPIGTGVGNPFPDDVSPRQQDLFTGALAHELNHIVDGWTIGGSASLNTRKAQLIQRAGRDPMNYLRSMLPEGFFVDNPGEFFASIANAWFCDSEHLFDLGRSRFDAARPEPLNQALFFAEVYSLGGSSTLLYRCDLNGNLTRTAVPVGRDAYGAINRIDLPSGSIQFVRDADGNVFSYQFSPPSSLVATATSPSQVTLSWAGLTGASAYEIARGTIPGGFTTVGTTSGTTYTDSSVQSNKCYLYRVRASVSGQLTAYSNVDIATMMTFSDDPIQAGVMVIRSIHLTELRSAVNAVLAAAGLPAATYTDSNLAGAPVKAIHIQDLRNALATALSTIGIPARSYTNAVTVGGIIQAVDINETRNALK